MQTILCLLNNNKHYIEFLFIQLWIQSICVIEETSIIWHQEHAVGFFPFVVVRST